MTEQIIYILLPQCVRWSQLLRIRECTGRYNVVSGTPGPVRQIVLRTVAGRKKIKQDSFVFWADETFDTAQPLNHPVIVLSVEEPLPENLWKNEDSIRYIGKCNSKLLVLGTAGLILAENGLYSDHPVAFPRNNRHLVKEGNQRINTTDWHIQSGPVDSVADDQFLEYALFQWYASFYSVEWMEHIRKKVPVFPPLFDQRIFRSFRAKETHDDLMVSKAQKLLHEQYEKQWNIEELSRRLYISRRQFDRRFKAATGYSAPEYLKRLRLDAAGSMLRSQKLPVEQVAQASGYQAPDAFRSVFKLYYGCSPSQYRAFFNKKNPE